jgi:hypothetical protein
MIRLWFNRIKLTIYGLSISAWLLFFASICSAKMGWYPK